MSSYDEAVGKVDGIVVTARHGGKYFFVGCFHSFGSKTCYLGDLFGRIL
jgi:hypothetical protein